jgi:hypothetical protein
MMGISSGSHAPAVLTPTSGSYTPHQVSISSGSHTPPPHYPYVDPLAGEAATNRGLVSSRSVRPRAAGQSLALIGAVAAIVVCVGAVVAVALVSRGDAVPAAAPPPPSATAAAAAEPTETAEPEPTPTAEPSASAAATGEPARTAAPRTARRGSGGRPAHSADAPPPAQPPPPPTEPDVDDVRNPFE